MKGNGSECTSPRRHHATTKRVNVSWKDFMMGESRIRRVLGSKTTALWNDASISDDYGKDMSTPRRLQSNPLRTRPSKPSAGARSEGAIAARRVAARRNTRGKIASEERQPWCHWEPTRRRPLERPSPDAQSMPGAR